MDSFWNQKMKMRKTGSDLTPVYNAIGWYEHKNPLLTQATSKRYGGEGTYRGGWTLNDMDAIILILYAIAKSEHRAVHKIDWFQIRIDIWDSIRYYYLNNHIYDKDTAEMEEGEYLWGGDARGRFVLQDVAQNMWFSVEDLTDEENARWDEWQEQH
jgi:hypothetical protein